MFEHRPLSHVWPVLRLFFPLVFGILLVFFALDVKRKWSMLNEYRQSAVGVIELVEEPEMDDNFAGVKIVFLGRDSLVSGYRAVSVSYGRVKVDSRVTVCYTGGKEEEFFVKEFIEHDVKSGVGFCAIGLLVVVGVMVWGERVYRAAKDEEDAEES